MTEAELQANVIDAATKAGWHHTVVLDRRPYERDHPPSYHAMHARLERRLTKPDRCTRCGAGGTRIEWALRPDTPLSELLYDVATRLALSVDERHYVALCAKCHRTQDFENYPRMTHCPNGHDRATHGVYRKHGPRAGQFVHCNACRNARRRKAGLP